MRNTEPSAWVQFYSRVHQSASSVLEQSAHGEHALRFASSHSRLADFEPWTKLLEGRLEVRILRLAVLEQQRAIYALLTGAYRQAFAGLRLFLELGLSTSFFATNELRLRQWIANSRDIVWTQIVDEEQGLFSVETSSAFAPQLGVDATHFRGLAMRLYRELSQYVHGNAGTIGAVPSSVEYSDELALQWHEMADTGTLLVQFALCLRYLPSLSSTEKRQIESPVLDRLGSLAGIRSYFDEDARGGGL